MARIQFNHLISFVTVAEELSFRRAAERLHMSQPPLSVRIKRLEDGLGAKLFDRGRNKRVILTPAGQVLFRHADKILKQIDKAANETKRAADGLTGSLFVGYTDDFFSDLLPKTLANYCSTYPDVFLSHEYGLSYSIMDRLVSGLLDCVLTIHTGISVENDLTMITLSPTRLGIALPKDHPLADRNSVELKELVQDVFLPMPDGTRSLFNEICSKMFECSDFKPRVGVAGLSVRMQLEMVSSKMGILLCSEGSIPTGLSSIKFVPLVDPLAKVQRVAIYNKNNPAVTLINNFTSILKG